MLRSKKTRQGGVGKLGQDEEDINTVFSSDAVRPMQGLQSLKEVEAEGARIYDVYVALTNELLHVLTLSSLSTLLTQRLRATTRKKEG